MRVYRWSNQYGHRKHWFLSSWMTMFLLPFVFGWCFYMTHTFHQEGKMMVIMPKFAYANSQVIFKINTRPSPILESYTMFLKQLEIKPSPTLIVTPTPSPDPTREEIDSYIRQVFGKDSNKAFELLSCENSSHDPNMVNTYGNSPEGSRDIGVMQINEYWQGVQGKFLFNWKINIEIAKQLYDENGGHFNLWTCGQKLGI